MRIIIKIAKNELRNLFYSPVAWFLSLVLLVMSAYFYGTYMYFTAKSSDILYQNIPRFAYWATSSVTAEAFSKDGGFFPFVMQHLYLFVPLLTMNVISREFNSGTIRLLYSSPVKLGHIVLGKFLAIAVYNLLLVALMGIFVVSAIFDILQADYMPLFVALLGIYLFLCALTAIGFFMSSLTNSQIVSAIATFTLLFILMRIGKFWQEYDFLRDITNFLSIAGRTDKSRAGLLTTKDIMYYLIIMTMFVCFTLFRLKAGREWKPWYIHLGRYTLVVVGGTMLGYICSLPVFTGYWDATANKVNTIHPRTQEVIKELGDSPLEVTLYTNLFASKAGIGLPAGRSRYISDFWEFYQRFKKNTNIEFKYEYYYAPPTDSTIYKTFPGKTVPELVGLVCRMSHLDSNLFKTPEEMRKIIDLKAEDYQMVMQLKYKGRTALLRAAFDEALWPNQTDVIAALKRVLQEEMPKVYYLTGELERSIHKKGEREYSRHSTYRFFMDALINSGFDLDTLNLQRDTVPQNASILVLADPKIELSDSVLRKLKNYIAKGGNMLIMGEPGKQYVLNPLLREVGVQLADGQAVQLSKNESPARVSTYIAYPGFNLAEEIWFLKYRRVWSQNLRQDTLSPPETGVTGITLTGDSSFTVTPLMLAMPGRAWQKAGKLVADSSAPVYDPLQGDTKPDPLPLTVAVTRNIHGREQRIIVSGDADYASNLRCIEDWIRAQYSWLAYNKFPVYTPDPVAKDFKVKLGPARAAIQKITYIWVLPAMLLLIGTVVLVRRKRK